MVALLLVTCRHTACSRLTLTHQCWPVYLLVSIILSWNYCVLACKETTLSPGAVVVVHKSAEGVQTKLLFKTHAPSASGIFVNYDIFMMQLKCYNCHVKHSEIWLVLPTLGQRKCILKSGKLLGLFFPNKQPGYEATYVLLHRMLIITLGWSQALLSWRAWHGLSMWPLLQAGILLQCGACYK